MRHIKAILKRPTFWNRKSYHRGRVIDIDTTDRVNLLRLVIDGKETPLLLHAADVLICS